MPMYERDDYLPIPESELVASLPTRRIVELLLPPTPLRDMLRRNKDVPALQNFLETLYHINFQVESDDGDYLDLSSPEDRNRVIRRYLGIADKDWYEEEAAITEAINDAVRSNI